MIESESSDNDDDNDDDDDDDDDDGVRNRQAEGKSLLRNSIKREKSKVFLAK